MTHKKTSFQDLNLSNGFLFAVAMEEDNFPLGDETTRIFINTKGKNPDDITPELLHLLEYINDSTDNCAERINDENVRKLHEKVKTLKKNRTLEGNFMYMYEYIRDEAELLAKEMTKDARTEGRAEGRAEGRSEATERMLSLVNAMFSGGDADKIPLLKDDKELLNEMFEKYNL